MPEPINVLFVCLGNICRSPMAEGIFRHQVKKPPYRDIIGRIDSCGTGAFHRFQRPDERTMSTLEDNGITDYQHQARQFELDDLDQFDYIFAMDLSNLLDLQRMQRNQRPNCRAKLMLFGEYGGGERAEVVNDPYYGGRDGFSTAFEQCSRFSRNFLKELAEET